ncbi:hypothetical protein CPC08DRAFT_702012 [Agrocybe pediades]|nr:hypothetical protein CPC08DRAFT_702012 [Agrocybe pediades]
MPAPKTKSASATNGSAKAKTPSTSGTATPVADKDTSEHSTSAAGGRPDKKAYDAEQARIKSEIDALQVKLSAVRDKIASATKSGPANERQKVLRAELDSIRDKQSLNKNSRSKQLDQINAINESIAKKVKDLNAAKSKIPYKTVADVDAQIKNLEKQIDSGNLKLADEKRALQEISSLKRNRRAVEGFQAEQDSIDADRKKVEELRKEREDPAAKAISDRYEALWAELNELKKEADEAYQGRAKLFEERDNIQAKLTTLFDEKRASAAHYREANDRYWAKVNEDRARRAERARAQRAEEEAQKKKELAERLLEDAQAPAFQSQIEDCQTLIDFFSGKSTNITFKSTTSLPARAEVAGVPKLELRQVEDAPEGLVARKKKGEEDNTYFIATKKNKNTGNAKKTTPAPKAAPKANGNGNAEAAEPFNLPLPTLTALLSLSIPPPGSKLDVPRVIEDLTTKKLWFEANQDRVTAENVAKAQAEIKRLTKSEASEPPIVKAEIPAEPQPTPVVGVTESPLASEDVVEELEVVQEEQEVASS